jgi:hypothetical protein
MLNRDEALAALAEGQKDLVGAELQGADLRGQDLRGVDFTDALLQGADLRDADLTGARLADTDLRGANLARATLVDAYLGPRAERADMTGVDMTGATLNFNFLAAVNNARLELAGATMPDGTEYQHPSTGAMSYGLAQVMEQGRRMQEERAQAPLPLPPTSSAPGGQIPSTAPPPAVAAPGAKPKNAILGWFVVAFVALAFLQSLGFGFYENPVVPIACLVLGAGLVIKRARSGSFGKGWFLATTIVGFLLFFGAVGIAQSADGSGNTGGGIGMLVPAILALIARVRA